MTANRLLMKQPPPSATQDAVFQLLGNPASFGLPAAAKIARHQTHAAIVFLSGDRVLKVKRAVQYPFFDFSSLEKRKAACEAELVINRKFAPQLYCRRVPITRERDGALALDGNGEPVEWAVEMARFDENRTLDRLAERGELNERLLAKLAVAVAMMHESAAIRLHGLRLSNNSSATIRRSSADIRSYSREPQSSISNANRLRH